MMRSIALVLLAGCTVQTRADLRRDAWEAARAALAQLCDAHRPEPEDGLAYQVAWAVACARLDEEKHGE